MTPNAFCKFFKKRTNKTYVEFLTEVRISQAEKFLKEQPEIPIVAIAEKCGFPTLSHFNRTFKKLKSQSPREFRKFS